MSDLSDFEDEVGDNPNFNCATKFLEENVTKIDQNNLLVFYGLYKQATVGQCNTPKPGIFNLQAKSKWNSWNNLGDMTKSEAMNLYIEKLQKLFPNLTFSDEKTFNKNNQWVAVSCFKTNDDEMVSEGDKNIFDYVKESNIEKIKYILNSSINVDVNELDDSGMGLIHWAADRGDEKILEILLEYKANINLLDSNGQTALHYASSCGNIECVKTLLKYNADRTIKDNEEMDCYEVALDNSISTLIKEFQN